MKIKKQFFGYFVYRKNASIGQIQSDFQTFLQEAEIAKSRIILLGNLLFFLIASLLVFILFTITASASWLLIFFSIVFLVIFVIIYTLLFKGECISQARLEVLPKILSFLQRDLNQKNVKVYLDLNANLKRKIKTIPHPRKSGFMRDFFKDPWLKLSGCFLDDTEFNLQVTEFTICDHGIKYNARGKGKYKSRLKSKGVELELFLSIPRKKYGAVEILQQDAIDAIQLPSNFSLKKLSIKQNNIKVKVKSQPFNILVAQFHQFYTFDYQRPEDAQRTAEDLEQAIGALFLGLYQILNLARELSKPVT